MSVNVQQPNYFIILGLSTSLDGRAKDKLFMPELYTLFKVTRIVLSQHVSCFSFHCCDKYETSFHALLRRISKKVLERNHLIIIKGN